MTGTTPEERYADPEVGFPIPDLIPADQLLVPDRETELPGVLDRLWSALADGIGETDPRLGEYLSRSDAIDLAFWSGEAPLEKAARDLLTGTQSYERVIRDGFWSRVTTWFSDFDLEEKQPSPVDQRLPIAELHAPHVAGCSGTFALSESGTLEVSVKAFGIGARRSRKISLGSSVTLPEDCCELTTGVEFDVHVWRHRTRDVRRALVDVVAIDGTVVDRPLDPDHWHPCRAVDAAGVSEIMQMARLRRQKQGDDYSAVPMRGSRGKTTHTMSIERGTIYDSACDLPISWPNPFAPTTPPIGSVSFSIQSTVLKTIEYGWELVKGHDYLRYRAVPDDKRMFWVWE